MTETAVTSARDIFGDIRGALVAQPWVPSMRANWPTPVACEVEQLLRMLEAGTDAGGILMQVRDTAEVLLKALALVAAADLIAHGGPDRQVAARKALFSGALSLGGWRAMLTGFAKLGRDGLLVPELLDLGAPTGAFQRAMGTYVAHRNADIGHGAYRPDSVEIAQRVEEQLLGEYERRRGFAGGLDRALAAVAAAGVWEQCTFHVDGPGGPAMGGAGGVHVLRSLPGGHDHAPRRLVLVRGDRSLDLYPFIAGRICNECEERDTFLFDTPKYRQFSEQANLAFDFIDWANGHRLKVDARKSDRELADLASIPLADLAFLETAQPGGGEFSSRDVVRLLDDIMFDHRFISPDWLRQPLRRHMEGQQHGIFWLRAPAHVGKSMFVRGLFGEGLTEDQRRKQRDLLSGQAIEVLPIFLKREYRFGPAQVAMALENRARLLARDDTNLKLRLPDSGSAAERQEGFARFAAEALKAAQWKSGADRLIIALDGLDELREPEEGTSALDMVPPADALPDGVTLLLTSRAAADCPVWLQGQMEQLAPGHERFEAGTDDPGYLALLRHYIARHAGVGERDEDFPAVCATVLEKSEALFLIVSFLCDLIREGSASGLDSTAAR